VSLPGSRQDISELLTRVNFSGGGGFSPEETRASGLRKAKKWNVGFHLLLMRTKDGPIEDVGVAALCGAAPDLEFFRVRHFNFHG
jgi:hypothetical protein